VWAKAVLLDGEASEQAARLGYSAIPGRPTLRTAEGTSFTAALRHWSRLRVWTPVASIGMPTSWHHSVRQSPAIGGSGVI
jgi:hypothetical protein